MERGTEEFKVGTLMLICMCSGTNLLMFYLSDASCLNFEIHWMATALNVIPRRLGFHCWASSAAYAVKHIADRTRADWQLIA